MSENREIIKAIRSARNTKGLSQSELSARIGVPQSHISKIENGAVDLKLSSLVQIARALDLEVKLVPRKSLPAVESIVRSTNGFPRDRTGPALSEIKKLERILERVSANIPSANLSLPLENIDRNLQSLKSLRYDTKDFVRLRKALEPISHISEEALKTRAIDSKNLSSLTKELSKLNPVSQQLSAFRNSLVHLKDSTDQPHRPAYSFEEGQDE